jgi:amino acid permease
MLVVTACAAHVAIRLLVLAVDKSGLEGEVKYTSLGHHAYGRIGEVAAAAAVGLQQLGPCVMYIQISADVLVPILCEAGGPGGVWCNRTFWQLVSVIVVIYPICLIRRMDSLK